MSKTTKKLKKEPAKSKKPVKKAPAAKEQSKKVTKKAVKKATKSSYKVSKMSGKKMFELEIGMLDSAQNDLFELIANRPDASDIEAVRLYIDNVFQVMNRVVTLVMETKNSLLKKEIQQSITETYNSPA